jgi:hypothetical protein
MIWRKKTGRNVGPKLVNIEYYILELFIPTFVLIQLLFFQYFDRPLLLGSKTTSLGLTEMLEVYFIIQAKQRYYV